jgi:hypothetical protein
VRPRRISTGRWCWTTEPSPAKKVTEFLKESADRFRKTTAFCVDHEHAARMRQALINENADLFAKNHRYVMRITGSDAEGQEQLDNFIDPESTILCSSPARARCRRAWATIRARKRRLRA